MMAMILIALLLILVSLGMAVVAAVPLFRTITILIDGWADSVHGR